MQLEAILSLSQFKLPAVNPGSGPFVTYAEDNINEYINLIKSSRDLFDNCPPKFDDYKKFCKTVERFGTDLIRVIRLYKSGEQNRAYQEFVEIMTSHARALTKHSGAYFSVNKSHVFYRAVNDKKRLGKNRFFHAAFEDDHFVGGTRFSIPGIPALYLANSLIVGYKETSTVNLNHFQAVKIQPNDLLSFFNLDFTNPKAALKLTDKEKYDERLQVKGRLYPLLFLCHTMKTPGAAPQEYIIPQMVARWIKNVSLYDGIRYPSVQINGTAYESDFYNLYIPTKQVGDTGFCPELKDLFLMSDICAAKSDKKKIQDYFASEYPKNPVINPDVQYIEWSGAKQTYETTELGKMEFYLRHKFSVSAINL